MIGALLISVFRITSGPDGHGPAEIAGPYAHLLAASTDLGPADGGPVQLTVTLDGSPEALTSWARERGLSVRWRHGDTWAIVEGPPADMAAAFEVDIHDYRGRRGQEFYASPQQPSIPEPVRSEVTEVGRILGYTPYRMNTPDLQHLPAEVPDRGLTPQLLLNT